MDPPSRSQEATKVLEDGNLEIDNNAERSLRGIAVGRNNWWAD